MGEWELGADFRSFLQHLLHPAIFTLGYIYI